MTEHTEDPRGITFQPDIYPRVMQLLPAVRSLRLLDAGCGEGYLSRLMARGGYEVTACDYSRECFKAPEVPFVEADLNGRLPFADGQFDGVVSVEVLEHLENHVSFIRELLRITRPGGSLILTTPNILSIPSRWHFLLYGYTDCAPRPLDPTREEYYLQHINPIGLDRLLFLIERFGGEVVDLTTNRVRRSARIPLLLLAPLLRTALRGKLLRRKYSECRQLYARHAGWMTHPANLGGRITIAVARKRSE